MILWRSVALLCLCAVGALAVELRLPVPLPLPIPAQEKFLGTIWGPSPSAKKPGGVGGWQGHVRDPRFGTLFTQLTAENCGKWGVVEDQRGTRRWEQMDQLFAFAAERGMSIKHHGFVWGQQQPDWLKGIDNATAMRGVLDDWMSDFFRRYGDRMDRVYAVEVVNEPLNAPAKYRNLLGGSGSTGWDWVIYCYERARHHASAAGVAPRLILNEWGMEKPGKRSDSFRGILKLLQERRLVDMIGLQGHFLEGVEAPQLRKGLDEMAALGLPILITEFELDIADDAKQLAQMRSVFPTFWEHPAVAGVTFWGHQQGAMWRKNGYLVRSDGSERPALTWLRGYLAERGVAAARGGEPAASAPAAR